MPRTSTRTSKYEILTTFAEMVARLGYDEVSLRMIAEELSLSKGTIVHHYGTKDRMLEAVHHEYMTRRLREARRILEQPWNASERISALMGQLLLAQRDDRAATVAFAREISRFSAMEVMNEVRTMRNEYSALVRTVIEEGMADGSFRADNPDLISLQIFGMCNWAWTWLRPEGRWSVAEIAKTWTATVLTGLTAPGDAHEHVDIDAILESVERFMAEGAAAPEAVRS
jgi:AcrR family transcriptional regulator